MHKNMEGVFRLHLSKRQHIASITASLTAMILLVLCGAALAADPVEPLAGTWKDRIVPKQRAIITYMNNTSRTMVTFRGQDTEVTSDLSGNYNHNITTAPGNMSLTGGDTSRVFAMSGAGGQVRDSVTLETAFYGQQTFPDVPLGVLCNAYIAMKNANGIDCSLFLELTNKDGRIGVVELSGIPKPAYKYYYRGESNKNSVESPELDRNVVTDVQAYDWNLDGFTDYIVSYAHNTIGNNNYDGNRADLLRIALVYVDGKSLYEASKAKDGSLVKWSSDISPVFGDWTDEVESGGDKVNPANSARTAIGDLTGDGVPELALYHTRVGGDMEKADNGLHVFTIAPNADGTVNFGKLYERLSDAGSSVIQCDSVGVAIGDINGDGENELVTAHAMNQAKKPSQADNDPSEIYFDAFRYNPGKAGNRTESFDKVVVGKHLFDWYNSFDNRDAISIAPIELAVADLDGDGIDEVAFVGVSAKDTGKISLWVVKWAQDADLNANPAPTFYQEYDISALGGWSLDWRFSRYSMTTGLFSYPDETAYVKQPQQIAVAQMGNSSSGSENTRNLDWGIFSWSQVNGAKLLGKGLATDAQRADNVVPKIVAADIDNEAMILGEPTSITVTTNIELVAAIQAPPKHWDVISADTGGTPDENGNVTVDVFATMDGYYTSYSTSATTTEIRTNVETSASSFGIGGTRSKSNVNLFKDNTPISSKTKQRTSEKASETTSSKTTSVALAADAQATVDDMLYFNAMDYTIWRYPVLFPLSQRLVETTDENGNTVMEQKFLQVVVPEKVNGAVFPSEGLSLSWYEPNHDSRNIFTYPRTISAASVAGYPVGQSSKDIDDPWYDLNGTALLVDGLCPIGNAASSSGTIQLSVSGENSVMNSIKKTTSSNSSRTIPLGPAMATARGYTIDMSKDKSYQTASTSTTNASKMAGISVNWPGTGSGSSGWTNVAGIYGHDLAFSSKVSVYTQDDGAIASAYSVTDFDGQTSMWGRETSPYHRKPDIALNLPHRYTSALTRNTQNEALLIRGLVFDASDEGPTTSVSREGIAGKALPQNTDVSGTFRVFNASFVDSGAITIEMFYQQLTGGQAKPDLSQAVPFGGTLYYENSIPGRNSGANLDNWIDVRFDWKTPAETQIGYLHVKVTHAGEELNSDNNHGYVLVAAYDPSEYEGIDGASDARGTFFDDIGVKLNVTSVRVLTPDGEAVSNLQSLPHGTDLTVEYTISPSHESDGGRQVRGVPLVRALLFADDSLVAGKHVPLIRVGNSWTFQLPYRHRGDRAPSALRLVAASPFLSKTTADTSDASLSNLNFASGSSGEETGGGSSGCNATNIGLAALTMALASITAGRKRKN